MSILGIITSLGSVAELAKWVGQTIVTSVKGVARFLDLRRLRKKEEAIEEAESNPASWTDIFKRR